jgi:hypothetical protein
MNITEYKENFVNKKKNKMGNQRVTIDGINFDSKKEAKYYVHLKKLKDAGEILDFKRQVSFPLIPDYDHFSDKVKGIKYYLDFLVTHKDGRLEYIDIKPSENFLDSTYKLKRKMFHYFYNDIKIIEISDF